MAGDNRYHSIFGAVKACVAVNPSDIAPALVALNAKVVTTKQTIDAENFWDVSVPGSTVLASDEIVREIQIPTPAAGVKSAFIKFALRNSIDFPIVNCAAAISSTDARICLNAVYNTPYRANKAEDAIKGKVINEANAEAAGAAAVASALALSNNKWKIQAAKGVTKQAILACA
jgi:xanthine dehydrogenase YagS FAD-binding subunit